MNKPKIFEVEDQQGQTRIYKIEKIPYLDGGREVCSQYITTAAPKVGNYEKNQDLAIKMFKYIAVVMDDGTEIKLTTNALINNHIPDFSTGVRLEVAALEHNAGFSVIGLIQKYQQKWMQDLPNAITRILTLLRDSLLQAEQQPSESLKPSTAQKTP